MLAASTALAHAAPYMGLDADRTAITLKGVDPELYPQSAAGEDIHIGERFGNVAGELSYSSDTFGDGGTLDNLHLDRLAADGVFYLPIYGGLNILAIAGGGEINYGISSYARNYFLADTKQKTINTDQTLTEGDEFDWRAGGGLSFGFDQFEIRAVARYQPLSMQHQAQNALSLDIGLNVYF